MSRHASSALAFLATAAFAACASVSAVSGSDDVGVQDVASEGVPPDDSAPIDSGHDDPAADSDTPIPDSAGDPASDLLEASVDAALDPSFDPGPNPATVPIFDESSVVEFHVTFPAGEFQRMLDLGVAGSKEYVHCSFEWSGETFVDAACRRRGNPTDYVDETKPQFTVRFNEWDSNGRFHGLRRIKLESFPGECAPIRDRLAFWVLRESGIDAPRANHAKVFRDGVYLGLYENLEAVDREFLEDHFADPTGNLYESGNELKTNEDAGDTSDLQALQNLVDDEPLVGDHSAFFVQLAKMMDVGQVVREMAGETVFPTMDNFSNGAANYYYYDQPGRGFVVIPWDFDQVFTKYSPVDADPWAFWGPPEVPSDPNRLRQLLNQDHGWKQTFEDALVEIRDGAFSKLPDRVAFVCAQVHDAWLAEPGKWCKPEEYDASCEDIKTRIAARAAYLKAALGR